MPLSDPQEQLTRVTDDDATVLGPVARGLVHGNPSLIHRSAHVLVVHPSDGTLLLQKRSLQKDTSPGLWDVSVGGHVTYGQSYEEAVIRETQEELGITVRADDLEFLYLTRFRSPLESENTRSYLCLHVGPFQPDPDEISEVRFWTKAEIEAALSNGGGGVFTQNFEEEYPVFLASPHGKLLR
jgi:isopentenyldiphosphate isomerase